MMFQIKRLREHPELAQKAAEWFHQKWDIPLEAYTESIELCLDETHAIPLPRMSVLCMWRKLFGVRESLG